MEIEETIGRKTYRGFNLVHLRQGSATQTRWHITHQEAGMYRDHGFVTSEEAAKSKVDALLHEGPAKKTS